ncbi:MAG: sulfotransferase family protein [Gammaproteobacteria bacterium]|nr:sulfotransferase family protein [Gammaproteobacteria bacterium]
MAIAVIGAGFGRTGTESMKLALEQLGFGPCHHMKEVLANPEQLTLWRAIARGERPDWNAALSGYNSSIDWPSAFFWRDLSEAYPDAKIILTLRSSESWYKSMSNTIFRVLNASTDPESIGLTLIAERVFGGRFHDRDHAIAVYERNTAQVQAAFGEDRLLSHRLGDGWGPLCRFLDKPLPDQPFPRSNSTADFAEMIKGLNNAR